MKKINLKAEDGYKLELHIFEAEKPVAVVQIAHGMEEHQERYEDFANFLTKNGFMVVSADMRGHGYGAKEQGYFAKKDGDKLLVSDHKKICDYINKKFKNLPIYLFAHSMGTIISRVVLQTYSKKYDKVILSGYPAHQSGASFGILLTKIVSDLRGEKYKSKTIEKMGIGAFNRSVKKPKTNIDWICANEETIESYQQDPYCGVGFSVSAFHDLFSLVVQMNKEKMFENVNTNLPILLIAGEDDPCTKGEKGREKSLKTLKNAGFLNISQTTYAGMRHEILNEKNNKKVYNDILRFLKKGEKNENCANK